MLLPEIGGVFEGGGTWWVEHVLVFALVAGGVLAVWVGLWAWWRHRATVALRERVRVEMVPSQEFAPTREEIGWVASQLTRVPAAAGVLPRRAGAVRIGLACEEGQLTYRVEGPERGAAVLRTSAYPDVEVVRPTPDVPRIRFEGAAPGRGMGGGRP